MNFLKHCDQYKAFHKMPNRAYFYNSKNMGGPEINNLNIINGFLREIDTLRALDMPQALPQALSQKPRQRQLPPTPNQDDIYASFRGCARQQQSYAFSNLNYKKTRLNSGRS